MDAKSYAWIDKNGVVNFSNVEIWHSPYVNVGNNIHRKPHTKRLRIKVIKHVNKTA